MLFDTHAHLDFDDFGNDLGDVIERAKKAGIAGIIDPGCDVATTSRAIELSRRYDIVHAAAGIHPNNVGEASPGDNLIISRLAEDEHVVAVGEIGLDFYRDRTPRDQQARAFAGQLAIARETGLPVIIHFRNVEMNGIDMIGADLLRGLKGVFHCFGGSVEFALELVKWGFYIGFDGPLTYKDSDRIEVAKAVPLERCLVETDAPFLTPRSHRGSRNEPAYVVEVAEKLAEVKGIDTGRVIEATGENARALFNL